MNQKEVNLSPATADPQRAGLFHSHKPTQCDLIIEAFKSHGWQATLGQLLEEGRYSFGHKLTARLSDLRKQGFAIECKPGPNPSKNLYTMTPPQNGTYIFHFDEFGQGSFA